jgi:hypothetical protein
LERVLERLECPHNKLHSAGNDANFTLKALILLGIASYSSQYELDSLEPEALKMLDQLWDVAYSTDNELLQRPRRRRRKLRRGERKTMQQQNMWSFMQRRKWESTGEDLMLPKQPPPPAQRESIVRVPVTAEEQARIRLERQRKREWKEKQAAGFLIADGKEQWELAARQKMETEYPSSGFWGIDLAAHSNNCVSVDAVWKAALEDGFIGLFFGFLRRGFAHPLSPVYAYLAPFPGFQKFMRIY